MAKELIARVAAVYKAAEEMQSHLRNSTCEASGHAGIVTGSYLRKLFKNAFMRMKPKNLSRIRNHKFHSLSPADAHHKQGQ